MQMRYTVDVIVDMQNDFVTGALGTPEARAIAGPLAEEAGRAAREGHILVFTQDTHEANYLSTREGRALPVPHCLRGSEGHDLVPELKDLAGADIPACPGRLLVEKPTFGAARLPQAVYDFVSQRGGDVARFRIYGVCTDICVISNAMLLRAFYPEATIEILSGLCAGVTPESHRTALQAMRACQFDVLD